MEEAADIAPLRNGFLNSVLDVWRRFGADLFSVLCFQEILFDFSERLNLFHLCFLIYRSHLQGHWQEQS
jgi:hypothetical protein